MSKASQWTTSYNTQYRDRGRFTKPNPDPADGAYLSRTQAYYGTRASIAEQQARTAEVEALTNYGARQSLGYGANYGFATGAGNYNGGRGGAADAGANGSSSTSSEWSTTTRYTSTFRPLASKDLWSANLLSHDRPDLYLAPGQTYSTSFITEQHTLNSSNGSLGKEIWRDGSNSSSYGKTLSTNVGGVKDIVEIEKWDQSHIPGYQGFVRGIQYQCGNTYGATTRRCLSVPTDEYLEP